MLLDDPSFDLFGRQKLASSCTYPYTNQLAECFASMPFSSAFFLLITAHKRSELPRAGILVFMSLLAVELSHAFGHLLLFPRAEELIICCYFWFNFFFMYIVYESPITAGSWWRYIYRTKEIFMASYVLGAVLLIYAWYRYGYIASTALQGVIQIAVAASTSLSTQEARKAMYKWTTTYTFGVVLLVGEIAGCNILVRNFGLLPYHAFVDAVMGMSCYFQCFFICELLFGPMKLASTVKLN